MKYFQRLIEVNISPPDIKIDNSQNIRFKIIKSINAQRNSASIDIINLDRDTRKQIVKDSLINISAGYKYNVGLVPIGQGNVSHVTHIKKGTEMVTNIIINDGLTAINNKSISLSFNESSRLMTVLQSITAKLGLPIKGISIEDVAIKLGYSYVGSIAGALNDICNQYNLKWSIQDGMVQILGQGKAVSAQIVNLTADTGLIGTIEHGRDNNNYRVKCQLQPQLEVGSMVNIVDENLNNMFIIQQLEHVGDNMGDNFYTIMEVTTRA